MFSGRPLPFTSMPAFGLFRRIGFLQYTTLAVRSECVERGIVDRIRHCHPRVLAPGAVSRLRELELTIAQADDEQTLPETEERHSPLS
jgi:hypothetical protein